VAIVRREDGAILGDCGIHFLAEVPRSAEIGITLAAEHQRQGYATEALTAVLDYLFTGLGKHRVHGSVDPANTASARLLERVGMRKEAHFVESLWFKGRWADDLVFAILDREWKARKA
jgi:RimJ/RimL family protein N-acetyltransferase